MIGAYNASMGGTDQMGQSIASSRPLVRNRKWYLSLFIYSVEVSLYNSWLLYKNLEENYSFPDHKRSIPMSYLRTYKHNKKIIPSTETVFHNSRVAKRVDKCIRFDETNHFTGSEEKKSKFALSGKTTKRKCTKCDVKLRNCCFPAFHGFRE